jgi:hypothetical protein
LEVSVAPAVAFECGSGGVEGVAVDLDDQAVVGPEHVDLVAADASVGLRWREAGLADQLEQSALGFGTGEGRFLAEGSSQGCCASVVGVTAELLNEGNV